MKSWEKAASALTAIIGLGGATLAFWGNLKEKAGLQLPWWVFLAVVALCLVILVALHRKRIGWAGVKAKLDAFARYSSLPAILCLFLAVVLSVLCIIQSLQIKGILEMNATYYAGTLPDNMREINKLIGRARRQLTILVDFPAYGSFSGPEQFLEYSRAIDSACTRGVNVRLHTFEPGRARTAAAKQFEDESFDGIKAKPTFKLWVDHLHKGVPPANCTEFVEFLLKDDERFVNHLTGTSIVVERDVSSDPPVYIWVRDHEEAIFSFYNLRGGDSSEISFRTTNPELIKLLEKIGTQPPK